MRIRGGKRVVITIANYPMVRNVSIKTFLFQKFTIKNFIFLLKKLIRAFINISLVNKICPAPDYHFVCGTEAYEEALKLSKKTKIIKMQRHKLSNIVISVG